ncbi:DUF6858 family protein [Roseospirillum parvum]|uniref:Uncharacterized protein n=1 Tax=Roseospirillum parvum TaxID=83401 RepID=A0A1G7ZDQ6_9PROT|nr:hypothetical protein [Roseospirillum parvum]SDH06230.1 hypothetical protein SAMN05421742_10465 [Roseospirillum parvum]
MKQSLLMEKYPVFDMELPKAETDFDSVEAIVAELKARIEETEGVVFIADFDHYAHTRDTGGQIDSKIKAARNVVFCFGRMLPNPHVLAVRPRSIGVCDMGDHFHIAFLEAPMEVANTAMESWCKNLFRRG